jgi:curved DNA-binding protein CbpA
MNEEQLKARFRELCVKMHPDKNTDNPNATAEFQEMQQQYEERKAELAGDYTKARKGRERREREGKERQERERQERERERRERERRKVEMVVEQARLNRQKNHKELKEGDYIYAMGVDYHHFDTYNMSGEDILKAVMQEGVKPECVVKIELIVDCMAFDMLNANPSKLMPEGIFGCWDVIQSADPAAGVKKAKRVAKVIMFRSEHY